MARKSKNVYDRISEKLDDIKTQEEYLKQLNNELKELYIERDNLEMKQLFEHMRANNLTIEKATELLNAKSKSK